MDQDDIRESITEIKLDIREIKTLLSERAGLTKQNAANIGSAFKEIEKIRTDMHQLKEMRTQVRLLWGAFMTALTAGVAAFIRLFTK